MSRPGDLDTTFGVGGKVTTDFANNEDIGYSVAIQTDGKIILGGKNSPGPNFALARYNSDGSLDSTFGTDGKVTTDFENTSDYGYSVAIQTDGKIILGGYVYPGPNFGLARYNSNGSLDTTFGTGGKVTTDFANGTDEGYSVALQTDGKIILGGIVYPGPNFGLARYNSDGTLDSTFGTGGKVTTDFANGSDRGYSVALQTDGKIILGGSAVISGSTNFALARYNSDGSLDSTFGTGGKVNTDFNNSSDEGRSVALQTDGKIILGGTVGSLNNNFALARYNSDGSLDTTFGVGGKVTTDFGSYDYGRSVAIQTDGKIILGGNAFISDNDGGASAKFALARYHENGSLDTTFGTGGKVTNFTGFSYQVAIQTDSKIILGGYDFSNFTLARYVNNTFIPSKPISYYINLNYTLQQINDLNQYNISHFKGANYTIPQLKATNYTDAQIKAGGYLAADFKSAGYTIPQLKAINFTDIEIKAGGYSIADFKVLGYTDEQIKAVGYSVADFKSASYTIPQLKAISFTDAELKTGGYSIADFKVLGYTDTQIKAIGYSVAEFKAASYTVTQLKAISFTDAQIKAGGYSIADFKAVGYTDTQIKAIGYSVAEFKAASYTVTQLKAISFTDAQIKAGGYLIADYKAEGYTDTQIKAIGYSIANFKAAGYTDAEIKAVGFLASDFKAASYTIPQLKAISFTDAELKTGGYSIADFKAVGYTDTEIKAIGFLASDFKAASYTIPQLKAISFTDAEIRAGDYSAADFKAAGYRDTQLKNIGFTDSEIKLLYLITESTEQLNFIDQGSTLLADNVDDQGYTINVANKNYKYFNLPTNSYVSYNNLGIGTNGLIMFDNTTSSNGNNQYPTNSLKFFSFDARSTIKYYFDSNDNLMISTVGGYYGDINNSPFIIIIKIESNGKITVNYKSIGTGTYKPIIGWVGNNSSLTTDDVFYSTFDGVKAFNANNINGKTLIFNFFNLEINIPIMPICFPAGTPVLTDQGTVPIQKINPSTNTIKGKNIVAVTKTITIEDNIVCIEKDALGTNIPSQKTYISRNHELLYNKQMIKAKNLIGLVDGVYNKKYNGEILYNVLLDKHDKMIVNNLIVETLDPENIVAKLYDGSFTTEEKNNIIIILNNGAKEYKKQLGKIL